MRVAVSSLDGKWSPPNPPLLAALWAAYPPVPIAAAAAPAIAICFLFTFDLVVGVLASLSIVETGCIVDAKSLAKSSSAIAARFFKASKERLS